MIRFNRAVCVIASFVALLAFGSILNTASAGTIGGPITVTDDASTGVSSAAIYTHVLDFVADGTAATINGVPFTAAARSGSGVQGFNTASTFGWSSTNFDGEIPEGSFNGGGLLTGATPGSGAEKMLKDFYYNVNLSPTNQTETLSLTGLTPGAKYKTNVYYRAWDSSNRTTQVTFDEGGGLAQSITVDQNAPAASAKYISYAFTAQSTSMLMSYTPAGGQNNASWHDYGVTNQVVPEPSSLALAGCGLAALACLVRRRK